MQAQLRATPSDGSDEVREQYDRLLEEGLALQRRFDKAAEAGHPEAVRFIGADAEELLRQRVELLRKDEAAPIGSTEAHAAADAIAAAFGGEHAPVPSAAERAALEQACVDRLLGEGFQLDPRFDFDSSESSEVEDGDEEPAAPARRPCSIFVKDGVEYRFELRASVPSASLFGGSRIASLHVSRPRGLVVRNRYVHLHLTHKPNDVYADFDRGAWTRMCTDPALQRHIDRLVATIA